MTANELASLIDHTLLKADATEVAIVRLCEEAADHGFAAVCVNPAWVRTAAVRLAHSSVAVCTVVGFPLGASTPDSKKFETDQAIAQGAREIDMVMNIGAFKSGHLGQVHDEVALIARACHKAGAICKVIIEAALLTDEEKISSAQLVKDASADYVKTSTGFGPGGATVTDVALIRRTVGPGMGVKASGGIRDLGTVNAMVAAGATRIGTSAGLAILQELKAISNPSPV